jgi:hypothetical protein
LCYICSFYDSVNGRSFYDSVNGRSLYDSVNGRRDSIGFLLHLQFVLLLSSTETQIRNHQPDARVNLLRRRRNIRRRNMGLMQRIRRSFSCFSPSPAVLLKSDVPPAGEDGEPPPGYAQRRSCVVHTVCVVRQTPAGSRCAVLVINASIDSALYEIQRRWPEYFVDLISWTNPEHSSGSEWVHSDSTYPITDAILYFEEFHSCMNLVPENVKFILRKN